MATQTISAFLRHWGFKPHSSPVNSWDSFREDATALIQLWERHAKRVNDAGAPDRYLRVRCWDAAHFATNGKASAVGYAGRRRSLEHIKSGGAAYVVLSAPPTNMELGPGVWAAHANLERAYPVNGLEEMPGGDVFLYVGRPVPMPDL
jgi:hypothetical protein